MIIFDIIFVVILVMLFLIGIKIIQYATEPEDEEHELDY